MGSPYLEGFGNPFSFLKHGYIVRVGRLLVSIGGVLILGEIMFSCESDMPSTPVPIEKPVIDTTPKYESLETKEYPYGTVKMHVIKQYSDDGTEHIYKALESFEVVPNISDEMAIKWNSQNIVSGIQFENGTKFEDFWKKPRPFPNLFPNISFGAGESNSQVVKYHSSGINGSAPDSEMMNKLLWREKVYTIDDIRDIMGKEKFDISFKKISIEDVNYFVFTPSEDFRFFEAYSSFGFKDIDTDKSYVIYLFIRRKENQNFYIEILARQQG